MAEAKPAIVVGGQAPKIWTPDEIRKLMFGKPQEARAWVSGDPIIVTNYGRGGAGKTHLGFTFPGPIVLHDLELNTSETLRQFAHRSDIMKYEYSVPTTEHRDQARRYYEAWLDQYFKTMESFWRAGIQGTHIIDSVTRLWELIRFAIVPLKDDGKVIGSAWN